MRISKARTSAGFSTVEVLVAVAIVTLVGTIALLSFGSNDRARVVSQAADLALFLQEARLEAAETARVVEIRYLSDNHQLVTPTSVLTLDHRVALSPTDPIRIRPSGESSGGSVTLTVDEATARVHIDWLTGRVRVER